MPCAYCLLLGDQHCNTSKCGCKHNRRMSNLDAVQYSMLCKLVENWILGSGWWKVADQGPIRIG